MREIVYVQAGNLSNYTGTHFWNTQEAYLAEDSADSLYDFDVSFREGLSQTGRPTFCPRLLVFDRKTNFGTLAKSNALLGTDEEELLNEDSPALWNGEITEYKQDPIPKSTYHSSLEESDDQDNIESTRDINASDEAVRYWSDFNRVFYIPRTVQKLPDLAEWESPDGDWNHGHNSFSQYDEDHALMEGSLRLFLEETHAASYPIPTSFPSFFKSADVTAPVRRGILTQPVECAMFSSLSTGTSTAHLFSSYASAIESYLKRKPAVEALGFDSDEVKDLAHDLWALHDSFDDGHRGGEDYHLGGDEA
ncbi:hypothetical protein D9615_007082 [Tricholomella constricta]|uniref:Tubulin nucleotide-binding domain-like protein n=1 Tax=Tricholomella constricta TaxID=117010 RepID=A0A8H5H8A1_9AGAR|nr:hypothetical protein D9615_007082 [Tricholomella constricta]